MKNMVCLLALLLISNAAFATKARLLALGESKDEDASFYIKDDRRMFLNAAFINDYTDMVITEWGGSGAAGTELDTDQAPVAMGGFTKQSGNYAWGLYLGNESDTAKLLRIVAGSGTLARPDNQVDAFFGSSMGNIDWGVNALYYRSEDERNASTNTDSKGAAIRLGAKSDRWDAYANISLANEVARDNSAAAGIGNPKFDGKLGYQVGGSYVHKEHTFYASLKSLEWDQRLSSVTSEGSFHNLFLGWGAQHDFSATQRIFHRLGFETFKIEVKFATNPSEIKYTALPLVFAYEADATSWLTLRGSISHQLMKKGEEKNVSSLNATTRTIAAARYETTQTNGKYSYANETDVRAGASLTFGKLVVDGLVGVSSAGAETGVLELDDLMTRVAATYRF